jgi:hypothetical protein
VSFLVRRSLAMVVTSLFALACSRGGNGSPHRVHVMLGFHGNFYHSWRGDTPDEAGFGQDIRIVREILRVLDEANSRGLDARGYWDVENHFTYEEILPRHAPDILDAIARRVAAGRDEVLLMPYGNGLVHAMTEDELRANVRWAISNPWGSGVRDLFGQFTPIFRPQETTLSAGVLRVLHEEGVEGVVLYAAGVPFDSIGAFVPWLRPEQRYGATRIRLADDDPPLVLLPAVGIGDILDHDSLEKWLLELRELQTSGKVDRDLLLHVNIDADADYWLPKHVPTGFGWLPNVDGLSEHIEAVNRHDWAAFTTPAEWLASHPPEGEILVRQDLADGAFAGQYSWAEKFGSHEVWTVLEQSRLSSRRADAWSIGAPPPLALEAEGLLRSGRESSFFQRVIGLSTTHFGMSTPIVNEERQAVAERIVTKARDRARDAEALLAGVAAREARDGPADSLWAFEVRDARPAGSKGPVRSLLRLPVVFRDPPGSLRLEEDDGHLLPHALVDVEPLASGGVAATLWTMLALEPGVPRRLYLRPAPPARAAPRDPFALTNGSVEVGLDPTNGISSLRAEGHEFAAPGFLSAFVSYRGPDRPELHRSGPWRIEPDPPADGSWLGRVRLATRIPFEAPEDGEVAATVEATLSLPGDTPWLVADVEVQYPYTTKRDVLHTPEQKLRRPLDLRWIEVAPFEIRPRLEGSRSDPLRVWKHNHLGKTTWYELDLSRVNPANAEIDSFNHQVTAGFVAVSDREHGVLVAQDADVRSSFAFAPMRLREVDGRQDLALNPFGSYFGRQLDYGHSDGTGLGADLLERLSPALRPNGPSYAGETERFSLLIAPYTGDAPPEALRAEASSFFSGPAVVVLRAPAGLGTPGDLPHDLRDRIEHARHERPRDHGGGLLPPRGFLVSPTRGAADLVWDEPRDARVDGYEVAWRERQGEWRSESIDGARRHRVPGLLDGTTYEFRVRARGDSRMGEWTQTSAVEIGGVAVVEAAGMLDELPLSLTARLLWSGLRHLAVTYQARASWPRSRGSRSPLTPARPMP